MRLLVRAFWVLVFFTLFAFALNNEQPAQVHGFFGIRWQAPMVIVVLVAFSLGAALGVLAMVPGWWKHRRKANQAKPVAEAAQRAAGPAESGSPSPRFLADGPPREGL
ncbi:MAG: LapA family protein [Ideonella sp.]|nr:LapA family protein [Ideonella sp.]